MIRVNDSTVGSSLLGAMTYLDPSGVEKKYEYTSVLNLKAPSIFILEHLFQYPTAIVPETSDDDITREPIGNGAFTMTEYVPAERCRQVARKDYWRNGEDGKPLPYLDEIIMVQLGEDRFASWKISTIPTIRRGSANDPGYPGEGQAT